MNIRLKELEEAREAAGRGTNQPLPSVDIAPAKPVQTGIRTMSITGLQSGAFKAKLAEMKQKMVDAQNAGLAKVDAAQVAAAADIDTAIAGVATKIKAEVDDALQEFATFTNGGPA